ncbi:MAG TPA: ribonuclease III [Elusimicrobia bacterium]|nr:MAG: ribonuclease III [Elusimicrobia bacterium RIFOXYA12_FULL_49_49]OGS11818.1 MAG: ribonuclease III [Elusimicrobia bacterium RIFOXYB1_FULL_48_9]OGS15992.1 MAG: ribonuclease III [Elusimicrobia bacterium RIFOXYA2_FULL_47_53]OGS26328.1 MAG: ribonuclease III [Elusimicrobia bacterium RIFOXYB12_FULL_50_12]OGS29160.1 MAG: ribonuclease III [Elusimicrobia bacterium RIFOXYB2_FULL_46_23]HBU69369.1 ribonuclease III [Elusimicrobiota bacterium]
MPEEFAKLEKSIGFKFSNTELLVNSLTHKSYAAENGGDTFNERMEFLGDSILAAVVADFLYKKYPLVDEGRLSQLKSQIVCRHSLSLWAKKIKLGSYIFLSTSEDSNGGRKRESILSNSLEALIAGIYLDGGFEAASKFILDFLSQQKRLTVSDTKSRLQELIQSEHKTLPEYRVISESGPDHEKTFKTGVYLKKSLIGEGTGKSKKEAEQAAAKEALRNLRSSK